MVEAHEKVVEAQFGPQARAYVESAVHARERTSMRSRRWCSKLSPERRSISARAEAMSLMSSRATRAVVAADLSREMLAAVAATARGKGLSNIETVEAPAERLPFEDSTFDFVASRFSAHHWRDFGAGLGKPAGR